MIFRDFPCHTAWASAGKTGHGYCGLIEYQPKSGGAQPGCLQITDGEFLCEDEALSIASNVLEELSDITEEGTLIPGRCQHH